MQKAGERERERKRVIFLLPKNLENKNIEINKNERERMRGVGEYERDKETIASQQLAREPHRCKFFTRDRRPPSVYSSAVFKTRNVFT